MHQEKNTTKINDARSRLHACAKAASSGCENEKKIRHGKKLRHKRGEAEVRKMLCVLKMRREKKMTIYSIFVIPDNDSQMR